MKIFLFLNYDGILEIRVKKCINFKKKLKVKTKKKIQKLKRKSSLRTIG